MSAEAAGVSLGIKAGVFAALTAAFISIVAVCVGFTIIPLKPGDEIRDAGRRLAGGLFCSFTLGPLLASKVLQEWPGLLIPWQTMLAGEHILWAYLATAAPFIAVCGVLGFWIVAFVVNNVQRRASMDYTMVLRDHNKAAAGQESSNAPPQ